MSSSLYAGFSCQEVKEKKLPKGGVITSPFRYSLMIDYSDSGEYQAAHRPNGLPEQGSSAPDSTVAYMQ